MTLSFRVALALALACQAPKVSPEVAESCPRGAPEPLLDKAAADVRHARFERRGAEAQETVALAGGQRWQVRHWGCESYALSITLSLPAGAGEPSLDDTLLAAATHLREVHQQTAALRLGEVADVLAALAAGTDPPAWGQPTPFGNLDGMTQTLTLPQAPTRSADATELRLDLQIGPL
jgi:hypothetical protein